MTAAQEVGLSLGRKQGNGGRLGIPHMVNSRSKASESNRKWCAENPDKVAARGAKNRGENHYLWKGGSTNFNKSVRQMTENINWSKAVKDRDGCCQRCGSTDNLEAHHKESLEELMVRLDLKTRDDCRSHSNVIWAMSNGITLCRHCHYRHHNRGFSMKIDHVTFEKMPDHIKQMFAQTPDPVIAMFPDSKSGAMKASTARAAQDEPGSVCYGTYGGQVASQDITASSGSAARFYHQFPPDPILCYPKAGKADRAGSKHPTVKPIALMQYLVRHITPPGGVVLDPFAGSGTTAEAARREGFDCILMEAEPEYLDFLNDRFDIEQPAPAFDFDFDDILGEAMPTSSTPCGADHILGDLL